MEQGDNLALITSVVFAQLFAEHVLTFLKMNKVRIPKTKHNRTNTGALKLHTKRDLNNMAHVKISVLTHVHDIAIYFYTCDDLINGCRIACEVMVK